MLESLRFLCQMRHAYDQVSCIMNYILGLSAVQFNYLASEYGAWASILYDFLFGTDKPVSFSKIYYYIGHGD